MVGTIPCCFREAVFEIKTTSRQGSTLQRNEEYNRILLFSLVGKAFARISSVLFVSTIHPPHLPTRRVQKQIGYISLHTYYVWFSYILLNW